MNGVLLRMWIFLYAAVGATAAKLPCRLGDLNDATGRLAALLDAPYHDPTTLPPARDVTLSVGRKDAEALFALTVKTWQEYYDPAVLRPILRKVEQRQALSPPERAALKAIRKRAMLVRASFLALDAEHAPPKDLHAFVRDFGAMNDSLANGDVGGAARLASHVRQATEGKSLRKALDRFAPDRRRNIAAHLNDTLDAITRALARPTLPADDFHTARKRLREIQAVLRLELSFRENADLSLLIDHLHALNLRTGLVHDELVKAELNGAIDYDAHRVSVPDELRRDVTRLLGHLKFTAAPTSGSAP